MTEEGVMAVNIGCSPVDTPPSRGCGWSLAEEGASGLFCSRGKWEICKKVSHRVLPYNYEIILCVCLEYKS